MDILIGIKHCCQVIAPLKALRLANNQVGINVKINHEINEPKQKLLFLHVLLCHEKFRLYISLFI